MLRKNGRGRRSRVRAEGTAGNGKGFVLLVVLPPVGSQNQSAGILCLHGYKSFE